MGKLAAWIKAWAQAHSITSQSIAGAWVAATLVYANDPAFHDYVKNAYAALPHGLHSFVAGVVIPFAIFYRSRRAPAK